MYLANFSNQIKSRDEIHKKLYIYIYVLALILFKRKQ